MLVSFKNKATREIADGENTKTSRKVLPVELHRIASPKVKNLDSAPTVGSLGKVFSNRLEQLLGNRKGQHSIRINSQYRSCFRWTDAGPADVEVVDYHD